MQVNDELFDFKLREGYSAETSGGLLMMVDKAAATDLQAELKEAHGQDSWLIGEITATSQKNHAVIQDPTVIEVNDF